MTTVNIATAYTKYFPTNRGQFYISKEELALDLEYQFVGDEDGRYELDVAMWIGTILKGEGDYTHLIERMFILFYYGGLMYRGSDGRWQLWANARIPVAAVPSHAGRVLVQLPNDLQEANAFWNWLWGGNTVTKQPRKASTHEVVRLSTPEILPANRKKAVKESKLGAFKDPKVASFTGQYGVNIGLGGVGNINPFSGNTITNDGRFGHLYLYYSPPRGGKAGAVMIGSEASGPSDLDRLGVGTKDQYGGSHGLGGSTKYEASGAKRWKDGSWHTRGPTGSKVAYDGLFIDLVGTGWNFLSNQAFDPQILGQYGNPPQVATLPTIMSHKEWKKRRHVHGRANSTLKRLDTLVQQYHQAGNDDARKLLLMTIIIVCDEYILSKGPQPTSHKRVKAAKDLKAQAGAVHSTIP